MEPKEQQQQKYSYRYFLKASGSGVQPTQETDRNELLAYINEVLGIDRQKRKEGPQLIV